MGNIVQIGILQQNTSEIYKNIDET
jgi:hypothetical protein